MKDWTTPADLKAQVERRFERILAAKLSAEALFPLVLRLSRPSSKDLSERFDDVRRWIRLLEEGSKTTRDTPR